MCLTFFTISLKVDIGKVKNLVRKQRDSGLVEKLKWKKENNRGGFQQTGGKNLSQRRRKK